VPDITTNPAGVAIATLFGRQNLSRCLLRDVDFVDDEPVPMRRRRGRNVRPGCALKSGNVTAFSCTDAERLATGALNIARKSTGGGAMA
jgi:hypothetical protein